LGEPQSVRCLRTRFVPGYVGTGSVVIGNEDEAWQGIGGQLQRASIFGSIDDDDVDGLYLGKITINLPAIEDSTAQSNLIEDWIVIKDEIAAGAAMLDTWEVDVSFDQQVWFDNDSGYSPDYWYQHEEQGWLPVFQVARRPMEVPGKTDTAHAVGTTAAISVWNGTTSAGLLDTGDNLDAYNRFADIAITTACFIRAFPFGWEVSIAGC
jgi:hypothetical protein